MWVAEVLEVGYSGPEHASDSDCNLKAPAVLSGVHSVLLICVPFVL